MVTPAQLARIFPRADAAVWAPAISRAWQRFGFESLNAQAGYLGIIGNESGGLTSVKRENMAYSTERAKQVFSKARAHPDIAADRIARGAKAFAAWIYAGIIGNGDEASEDGWSYRGGGIIQLTGRANYKACGEALGIDLLRNPDLVCNDPDTSAAAAAWFMAKHARILPLLDASDEASFLSAARRVGLPPDEGATRNRLAYRKAALAALSESPSASGAAPAPRQPPAAQGSPAASRRPWWADLLDTILRALKLR